MTKKTPEKVNIVLYGACFALCFFAFMLTEASINERCAEVVGKQFVNLVYAVGLVCTGLGYLSFPALRRLCKGKDARKIMLCMIGLCCAAASFLLIKAQGPVLFLISSAGALFFFGHIGGSVFYNTAMFFNGIAFRFADIPGKKGEGCSRGANPYPQCTVTTGNCAWRLLAKSPKQCFRFHAPKHPRQPRCSG